MAVRTFWILNNPLFQFSDDMSARVSTFEQLSRIHQSTYQPTFSVKKHHWKSCSTDRAMHTLNLPDITQGSIRAIQALSYELFEHTGLIFGDSNDGNWGTRENGELVLFDWERFGFGSPAIDLAPLVKGLGTIDAFESIVEKYSQHASTLPSKELERHLIIAKVWILVEVTNILTDRNKPSASMYFNWYRENVPSWLMSVEKGF